MPRKPKPAPTYQRVFYHRFPDGDPEMDPKVELCVHIEELVRLIIEAGRLPEIKIHWELEREQDNRGLAEVMLHARPFMAFGGKEAPFHTRHEARIGPDIYFEATSHSHPMFWRVDPPSLAIIPTPSTVGFQMNDFGTPFPELAEFQRTLQEALEAVIQAAALKDPKLTAAIS